MLWGCIKIREREYTPVNKGKKKDRSVEAPILPPPPRCAPFLERRSSTRSQSVHLSLIGGRYHFCVVLGAYLGGRSGARKMWYRIARVAAVTDA
jgi:hypothetical protein